MCIFFNKNYIHLLKLLLISLNEFGKRDDSTDILIITESDFVPWIEEMSSEYGFSLKYMVIDGIESIFYAAASRILIFQYPEIDIYERILYLDTDIIISDKINRILTLPIESKLYALPEGTIGHPWWGGEEFFDFTEIDKNISAFSTCCLLFPNTPEIKKLFQTIIFYIQEKSHKVRTPITLEQPFVVYVAVTEKMYNNKLLSGLIVNHPESDTGQVISHFPIGPGDYSSKLKKMTEFYSILRKHPEVLKN
jgi:hypothetical protein